MKAKSTPDERFLIKIYEKVQGEIDKAVDYRLTAQELGLKETATKNIIKLLAQANFLKKGEGTTVFLTERGLAFVLEQLT